MKKLTHSDKHEKARAEAMEHLATADSFLVLAANDDGAKGFDLAVIRSVTNAQQAMAIVEQTKEEYKEMTEAIKEAMK